MGLLQQLRQMIYQRSLQKGIKARKTPSGKSSVNLKNAKNIGILFDATEINQRNKVLKYAEQFRKQGKKVRLLGFVGEQAELEGLAFSAYNNKGINWASIPKSEEVLEFIQQPFELLLNIETVPNQYSEYIAALSKAQLRVGPSTENTDCYDLMIGLNAKAGVDQFIQQMESLLGKTNIENEAAKL